VLKISVYPGQMGWMRMSAMSDATEQACRLCLVAPPEGAAAATLAWIGEAASGGDIASLIVPPGAPVDKACIALAQRNGIAVVWAGDTPPRGVDGVQVSASGAPAARHTHDIVGIDDIHTRHDAMTAAEVDPDYLFFGRFDATGDLINPAALDLAAWWASVAVVPGVVMGGRSLDSVRQAAEAGIEFVALGSAIWDDPRGPAVAVSEANGIFAAPGVAA